MRYAYHLLGIIGIVAYVLLFAAGLVIDSSVYRASLNAEGFSLWTLLAVALTYTPTNVALLSIFAGLVAGSASAITYRQMESVGPKGRTERDTFIRQSVLFRTESPIASMFRSLVVYFAFMAGVLVTTVEPFTVTTPEQYVRLAASVSFFSFAVGYDPTKLQSILKFQIPQKS